MTILRPVRMPVVLALSVTTVAAVAGCARPLLAQTGQDRWLAQPVDDATFRSYLDFFTYDEAVPFTPRVLETRTMDGVRSERLTFQSTPGELVFAYFDRAATATSGSRGAVIVLHGGTGEGKTPYHRALSSFFVREAGVDVLFIDLKHFGERSTGLLTTFTEQDKHERLYNRPGTYLEWVGQTVKDVGRAYDFLVRERGADPARIGLVGISRGAQLAFIVGAADGRLAAVAAVFGGHFDALETGHLPAACPANYIGRISPRPLFMVNGSRDQDYVRERTVEPLQRLARDPKEIHWIDTGHTAITPQYRPALAEWLRRVL
jgi:dienelactone hydrolase